MLVARGLIYELGEAGLRDLMIKLALSSEAFQIERRPDGSIEDIFIDWPRVWNVR